MISKIQDFDIRACNTFRIAAKALCWVDYTEASDLPVIFSTIIGNRKFRCIGQGSNMLFTKDYDGVLLHSRILDVEMNTDANGNIDLRVGSGVSVDDLIMRLCSAGIWGMENLSLIPGDMGSAAVQNVGAYGTEIGDLIKTVECYDVIDNCFITLDHDLCDYGYRWSVFKRPDSRRRYIVTYVNLSLNKDAGPSLSYRHLADVVNNMAAPTPMAVRNAVIAMRQDKLPDVDAIGSAGSFFKNPLLSHKEFETLQQHVIKNLGENIEIPHFDTSEGVKVPAAWLIEKTGWKGRTLGDAGVWPKQPLVLVNMTGKASADEIVELERQIVKSVESTFGITLHPEVDHIS